MKNSETFEKIVYENPVTVPFCIQNNCFNILLCRHSDWKTPTSSCTHWRRCHVEKSTKVNSKYFVFSDTWHRSSSTLTLSNWRNDEKPYDLNVLLPLCALFLNTLQ